MYSDPGGLFVREPWACQLTRLGGGGGGGGEGGDCLVAHAANTDCPPTWWP